MSQPIITCDGISKCYQLGANPLNRNSRPLRGFTLRDDLSELMHAGIERLKGRARQQRQQKSTFWALKDVSFEIGRGEVVGIVGKNGAGKSTLLKILSRIVDPSDGTARLRGRVASLLEVGTGFHPELSGRENIYLNGAILGMRKAEIDRRFDEIVAFAEIDRFLDTPAKRYSSGMYVRLAFAVAAHLEPEILIVDEVLAVGDFAFQKKCLGKMHDVAASDGRTILFVSHNLSALTQLCARAILLENGSVRSVGPVKEVVESYLKGGLNHSSTRTFFPADAQKPLQYLAAEVLHADGTSGSEFSCDEPLIIRLRVDARKPIAGPLLTFTVQNLDGIQVLISDFRDCGEEASDRLAIGVHDFEITIPRRLLAPTTYVLTLESGVQYAGRVEKLEACCEFTVRDFLMRTDIAPRPGVVGALLPWHNQAGSCSQSVS
jgi:lipopolysaccharide transport system ATP-binding protein